MRPGSAGQPIQKVVYYQNRFITIQVDPGTLAASGGGLTGGGTGVLKPANRDKSGSGMDPISLDPVQAKDDGGPGICATISDVCDTIGSCLNDNRTEGSKATADKFKKMNKSQDETNLILKKILNIIFVTTGMALFISVVIVIIYTSIGRCNVPYTHILFIHQMHSIGNKCCQTCCIPANSSLNTNHP